MESNKFIFDFEKLDVYNLGLEFLDKIFEVCDKFATKYQFSLGE